MIWTHNICEDCWNKREPNREAIKLKLQPVEICCFCGTENFAGIFVREHEDKVPFCTEKETMTPEIESLAQQLIEAADGAQKAADDDWNWRYEGTIIDPDKRAYIHLASPENITAVILAFREELKQARRDALVEVIELVHIAVPPTWNGSTRDAIEKAIRALMEKPE